MSDVVTALLPPVQISRPIDGLLGAGQQLAREWGGKHVAIVLGAADDSITSHVAHHCDQVMHAENDGLQEYQPEQVLVALQALCSNITPGAVLLANDIYSQELTPRLAHRLGGSSIGDASELLIHEGKIRLRRSVYGGKAMALVEPLRCPAVVWVRANAMEPPESNDTAAQIDIVKVDLPESPRTQIVKRHVEKTEGVRLEDAAVIVSGGRGLGGAEPFELIKGLAGAIGAEVAASRAASDAGWVPPSWQIGQTGKKVAPELYLAIAISGASQHMMGIADAKFIAAINTDADAPIFNHCQFGIVEDYRKVIGPLQEKLANLLS